MFVLKALFQNHHHCKIQTKLGYGMRASNLEKWITEQVYLV